MILEAFARGLQEAGAEVETIYASRIKPKACDCGEMKCWFKHPGDCCHDDLREVYSSLRQADILVLATPADVRSPAISSSC